MMRPACMRLTWSATLTAMWVFCSTRTMVLPSSLSLARIAKISWTITGARPSDGSSRRISRGSAMGRGLMAEPRLILLDEPSLGLAPVIVQEIFAILAKLKEEGSTIVLVEQNTHMAVSVADQVNLMQAGRIILSQ